MVAPGGPGQMTRHVPPVSVSVRLAAGLAGLLLPLLLAAACGGDDGESANRTPTSSGSAGGLGGGEVGEPAPATVQVLQSLPVFPNADPASLSQRQVHILPGRVRDWPSPLDRLQCLAWSYAGRRDLVLRQAPPQWRMARGGTPSYSIRREGRQRLQDGDVHLFEGRPPPVYPDPSDPQRRAGRSR